MSLTQFQLELLQEAGWSTLTDAQKIAVLRDVVHALVDDCQLALPVVTTDDPKALAQVWSTVS